MTSLSRIFKNQKGFLVPSCFLLLQGLLVNSQILPDAPVEGLRLTMFSDEGYKLWFLTGSTAAYLEDGSVKMTDMDLEVFKDSETPKIDMHILSNNAIYQVEDKNVSGDGGVFVEGEFYQIEGDSWNYSQEERVVTVTSNVKVLIDYELQPFLK